MYQVTGLSIGRSNREDPGIKLITMTKTSTSGAYFSMLTVSQNSALEIRPTRYPLLDTNSFLQKDHRLVSCKKR